MPTLSQLMEICERYRQKNGFGPTAEELHMILTQRLHAEIDFDQITSLIKDGETYGVLKDLNGRVEVIGKL